MKKLFVTDMDGTLLSTDSRVSPESAAIISDLSRRGALITVATARTPATVEPLLAATEIAVPAIVMTGAAMWDLSNHRFIATHPMPDSLAEQVTSLCRRCGLRPMSYTVSSASLIEMYVSSGPDMSRGEVRFIEERRRLRYKHVNLLPPAEMKPWYSDTILVFAYGRLEAIMTAADELKASGQCSVSAYPDIFNPSEGLLEVFAPGVSKAAAVLELKRMTGADSLTVFGDNLNDLPMMEVADCAVAVANAMEPVRQAADEIIGPNSTDSVARYIADHF